MELSHNDHQLLAKVNTSLSEELRRTQDNTQKMEEIDVDIEQLFNMTSKTSATASNLETEFNDLDMRGNRSESAISTLQEQLGGVENDVVRLDGSLDEVEGSISALEAQVQETIKQVPDYSQRIESMLNSTMLRVINKQSTLKGDIGSLQSQVSQVFNKQ